MGRDHRSQTTGLLSAPRSSGWVWHNLSRQSQNILYWVNRMCVIDMMRCWSISTQQIAVSKKLPFLC